MWLGWEGINVRNKEYDLVLMFVTKNNLVVVNLICQLG